VVAGSNPVSPTEKIGVELLRRDSYPTERREVGDHLGPQVPREQFPGFALVWRRFTAPDEVGDAQ
jgi:hypothetical protein